MRPAADRLLDIEKTKALMARSGKSYADLGRALGLNRQAVGHWFRKRGEPSVQQMKKIAAEIGVHWLELATEETLVVWQKEERRRVEMMRSLSPDEVAKLDAWLELNAGGTSSPG